MSDENQCIVSKAVFCTFSESLHTKFSQLNHLASTTTHVYWALVIEPVGEAKYKRVGLAMLYPRAFELCSKEFTEFEIV